MPVGELVNVLVDVLIDAIVDCAKLVPFLLLTILLMEYVEHRAADRLVNVMRRAGRFGPALGGALGLIPQCGFSAACAHLYNGGFVTAGTLIAVFLSTSDEAIPILISQPEGVSSVWTLMLVKLLLALAAGFLADVVWPPAKQRAAYELTEQPHECGSDGKLIHILLAAVKRTLSILLFLFIVTFALNVIIAFIGEDRLAVLLLPGPFQPLLAAVVGFVPNCAASVLLTKLYLDGMITFGSAVAGLSTASGIGLLVLLRGKRGAKAYLFILGFTFAAATLAGTALQILLP